MTNRTGVSITYGIGAMHAIQIQALPRELKTSARMLLLVLASHADNKTGKSFPSQQTLADECGMAKSGVQRNMDILVNAGLLKVTNRTAENQYGNRVKMTNLYQVINIPRYIGKPAKRKVENLTDRSWDEIAEPT